MFHDRKENLSEVKNVLTDGGYIGLKTADDCGKTVKEKYQQVFKWSICYPLLCS
jgi:hypothetical protein